MTHPHPSSASFLSFWFNGHSKMMTSALIVPLFVKIILSIIIPEHFPQCFCPKYVGRNVLKTLSALQMFKNFKFSKLINWPRSNMSDGIIITLNFHYFPIFILIKTPKGSPKQSLSHDMSQCLGDSSQVRNRVLGELPMAWSTHVAESLLDTLSLMEILVIRFGIKCYIKGTLISVAHF